MMRSITIGLFSGYDGIVLKFEKEIQKNRKTFKKSLKVL